MKVRPDNLAENVKSLFSGVLAQEWLSLSIARINAVIAPEHAAQATAQDGGELVEGISSLMTEEQWAKIRVELFKKD